MSQRFKEFSLSTSRLHRVLQKLKAREMNRYGLKGEQTVLLYELYTSEQGMKFAPLCQVLQLDPGLVSRNLKVLLQQNLVEKVPPNASYKATYRLSEKGRQAMAGIDQILSEMEELAVAGISPEELEIFYSVSSRLCANLEERLESKEGKTL